MSTLKLEADYRSDLSKSHTHKIRKEGYATASVFGHGTEPVSLQVKINDLVKALQKSDTGMTSLIDIKVKGSPENSDGLVIIKDFTKDYLSKKVLDIQFQRVFMKEKMHISVPVVLVGESAGEKSGGVTEQITSELLINTLPNKIPAHIEVDVTNLDLGHHITVEDINKGLDYEIMAEPDTLIVTCVAPRMQQEEPTAEASEETAPAEAAE